MAAETNLPQTAPGREGAPGMPREKDLPEFRRQLERVLDSKSFSGSRRLSAFLSYVSETAFAGRSELDQYEIAKHVLHRDAEFNPLDDASVRKLASQVRHKLEEYYAAEGRSDPVVITLPRRSYVPRFRYRDAPSEEATVLEPGERRMTGGEKTGRAAWAGRISRRATRATGRMFASGWAIAALMAAVLVGVFWRSSGTGDATPAAVPSAPLEALEIQTAWGDIRGPGMELAPGSVLLGPPVEPGEEVTVKMTFTPTHAVHQAGVMILDSPDRYLRLGRHFKTRVMREFAQEADGVYYGPEATYEYDPTGQTGWPLWLSIRRAGEEFEAYTSRDGFDWKKFGRTIVPKKPLSRPRAALYAFNGRIDIPSIKARFEDFAVGLAFHNLPQGPWDGPAGPEWTVETGCPGEPHAFISGNALTVAFSDDALGCDWRMLRPAPEGDWTFIAVMDFIPVAGSSAGLVAKGSNGEVRLVRRDLNSGSIMMELDVDSDVRVPDFPGYPLIVLRLRAHRGVLTGEFSRDGVHFRPVPRSVPLSRLGESIRVGPAAGIAHWSPPGEHPPAHFYRVQQVIEQVEPLAGE